MFNYKFILSDFLISQGVGGLEITNNLNTEVLVLVSLPILY